MIAGRQRVINNKNLPIQTLLKVRYLGKFSKIFPYTHSSIIVSNFLLDLNILKLFTDFGPKIIHKLTQITKHIKSYIILRFQRF